MLLLHATCYFLHAKLDYGGLFSQKNRDTYTLDDKFELFTHECGGVDTILTSVRRIVGEIRSMSVSSSVTFSDVSAIMSDK